MTRTIFLQPGMRYYGGTSLPWYAPRSIVDGALADMGFRDIQWHPRSERPPVDPSSDPAYRDDWDEWATAVYAGTTTKIEPLHERVSWALPSAPVPASPPSPAQSKGTEADITGAYLQGIVAAALQSGNPATIRQTAMHLRKAGYPELAKQMEWYAGRIGETKGTRLGPWLAAGGILLTAVGIFIGTVTQRRRR